jgi:hypothetical protein
MNLSWMLESPGQPGFRHRPGWFIVVLGLLGLQGLSTLKLFDPDCSGRSIRDDRPILSGWHPLHFYHAVLGANSWRDGGFGLCYDPAFQAGYPKTPVFDAGSRPGEMFLLLGGNTFTAYKAGLAVCCFIVPLVFVLAARWLECGPGTSCLAAAFAILWWWAGTTQRLLHQGDLDWLLAGLVLVLHATLTIRFHRSSSFGSWIGLTISATLGWFFHPIIWLGFGFLFVPFSIIVASAHTAVWSLALWLAWAIGIGLNSPWLIDWWRHCWIQMPLPLAPTQTVQWSFEAWFTEQTGGTPADRLLIGFILGVGLLGTWLWIGNRRSAAGWTFAATAILLPALSLGSAFWQFLEAIGTAKLLVLAGFFAIIPCASGLTELAALAGKLLRHPVRGAALVLSVLAALGWIYPREMETIFRQVRDTRPFRLGLSRDQQQLVSIIRTMTRPEARILWEERPDQPTPNWSALLPHFTDRAFLGGLDPSGRVDHAYARLTPTQLADRPFSEWTDAELGDFCERYNVGYIICWSTAVLERFRAWPAVAPLAPIRDGAAGWLLEVRRLPNYVLKGKAQVTQLDARRIALAEVEPEDGVVVLSLHYQDGFRITPNHIVAEREPDADDPIPYLRLRIPGPTLRVTLTWGKP